MNTQKHIWNYAIPNEIARASIRQNWSVAWEDRTFRIVVPITMVICAAIASFLPIYFGYIQGRQGVYLTDPVLMLIKPIDVSVFTFSLLYICVIMCLGYIAYFPRFIMKAAWAYCILTCLRMFVMLFVPLEAPKEMIFLVDPVLALIVYKEVNVTKDLFFSGHTATMFMLVFGMPNKSMKRLFIIGGIVMGALLLMQHVHYTVDVLVAPFFAYVSWRLAERLERQVFGSVSNVTEA
jgi:hypothetical protein